MSVAFLGGALRRGRNWCWQTLVTCDPRGQCVGCAGCVCLKGWTGVQLQNAFFTSALLAVVMAPFAPAFSQQETCSGPVRDSQNLGSVAGRRCQRSQKEQGG